MKLREGFSVSYSVAEYVGYEPGINDRTGEEFIVLLFLADHLLPSVQKVLPIEFLAPEGDESAIYNLKFKVYKNQKSLAKPWEIGQRYWLTYGSGMNMLTGDTGRSVTYEQFTLLSISQDIPETVKRFLQDIKTRRASAANGSVSVSAGAS